MSAIVCGKRSFFEDLPTSPNSASPPASKKLRCYTSTSPVRFSPFTNSPPSPSPSLIDKLRSFFPSMDKKLLENALQNCGNDLDSAIKSLNELCLGYVDGDSASAVQSNAITDKVAGLAPANVDVVSLENSSANDSTPKSGAEWVELFVTEMTSATSIDDARSRAMRVLESLEKSISERAGGEAAQTLHKENVVLKEQIEVVVRENTILKRAVAIQHERQKEHEERTQEVHRLKQLLSQHQEQLRTLEVNNYALTMHLRQAQENNSIPGRFHPDIF